MRGRASKWLSFVVLSIAVAGLVVVASPAGSASEGDLNIAFYPEPAIANVDALTPYLKMSTYLYIYDPETSALQQPAGLKVTFYVGATKLCTATTVTNSDYPLGYATCGGLVESLRTIAGPLGYTVKSKAQSVGEHYVLAGQAHGPSLIALGMNVIG